MIKNLLFSFAFLFFTHFGFSAVDSYTVSSVTFEHDPSLGTIEPGIGYIIGGSYVVEATRTGTGSVDIQGNIGLGNPLDAWPTAASVRTKIKNNIQNNGLDDIADAELDDLENTTTDVTDNEVNGLIGSEVSIE